MARTFTGANKALAQLKKLQLLSPNKFENAQYQETEIEAKECKRVCPVLTGTLRGTIEATRPKRQGRKITTSVIAGGPAAPYALIVHETPPDEATHLNGEWKFIENPLKASAPYMAERIAKRVNLNEGL